MAGRPSRRTVTRIRGCPMCPSPAAEGPSGPARTRLWARRSPPPRHRRQSRSRRLRADGAASRKSTARTPFRVASERCEDLPPEGEFAIHSNDSASSTSRGSGLPALARPYTPATAARASAPAAHRRPGRALPDSAAQDMASSASPRGAGPGPRQVWRAIMEGGHWCMAGRAGANWSSAPIGASEGRAAKRGASPCPRSRSRFLAAGGRYLCDSG